MAGSQNKKEPESGEGIDCLGSGKASNISACFRPIMVCGLGYKCAAPGSSLVTALPMELRMKMTLPTKLQLQALVKRAAATMMASTFDSTQEYSVS